MRNLSAVTTCCLLSPWNPAPALAESADLKTHEDCGFYQEGRFRVGFDFPGQKEKYENWVEQCESGKSLFYFHSQKTYRCKSAKLVAPADDGPKSAADSLSHVKIVPKPKNVDPESTTIYGFCFTGKNTKPQLYVQKAMPSKILRLHQKAHGRSTAKNQKAGQGSTGDVKSYFNGSSRWYTFEKEGKGGDGLSRYTWTYIADGSVMRKGQFRASGSVQVKLIDLTQTSSPIIDLQGSLMDFWFRYIVEVSKLDEFL